MRGLAALSVTYIAVAGSFFIFWGFVAAGATGNVRKSINVISEYDERFCRKGPEDRLFSKSGVSG
jgi:hypothetical protein